MSDLTDDDLTPPRPPPPQPKYLPRIKYEAPPGEGEDPDDAEAKPRTRRKKDEPAGDRAIDRSLAPPEREAPRKKKDKPKARRSKDRDPAEKPKGGVLVEETPNLDTVEARRYVRIGVGVVAAGSILLMLLVLFGAFRSDPAEDDSGQLGEGFPGAPPGLVPGGPSPGVSHRTEQEARLVLDDARRASERGDGETTARLLKDVVANYPRTAAAREAEAALAQAERGLPAFGEVVEAQEVASPESSPAVVEVVPPEAPVGQGEPDAIVAAPALPPPETAPEPFQERPFAFPVAEVAPRALPDGFRARPEAGVHETGWPLEITCDRDGSALVLGPGGDFTMGTDDGPPNEGPSHRVTLSTFYIDQHEVTNRQFRLYKERTGGKGGADDLDQRPPDLPVVEVSAQEALAFAKWAGKTLPTEARWELAARTIDDRLHPWGNGPPPWERPREPGQIDPVMSYPSDMSPYGAFDLGGNVAEWTQDYYDPRYHARFRGRDAVDPIGPGRGASRNNEVTIKGGSDTYRATWRTGRRVDSHLPEVGFRCVLPVERSPDPGPPGAAPRAPASGGGVVPF